MYFQIWRYVKNHFMGLMSDLEGQFFKAAWPDKFVFASFGCVQKKFLSPTVEHVAECGTFLFKKLLCNTFLEYKQSVKKHQ